VLCFYWIEVCCNKYGRYLDNIVDELVIMHELLDQLREARPNFYWNIECYHYETRSRQVAYTMNGQTYYQTQVYQEKVVTHTASRAYIPKSVEDRSPSYGYLKEYDITKLKLNKKYQFANNETMNDWKKKRAQFVQENKNDVFQDVTDHMDIPGYQDVFLVQLRPGLRPFWMNYSVYIIASVLCCSPLFRCCMNSKVGKKSYTLVKVISI